MKSWTHPASPTFEQNQGPSTFRPHHSPTFPTLTPHYPPTFPTLPPHYPHLPFLPFHLTTLPPSQLTSLPPTNKALQNNNIKPSVSPHIFLTEGSQHQNFKASSYSPSWETASEHSV